VSCANVRLFTAKNNGCNFNETAINQTSHHSCNNLYAAVANYIRHKQQQRGMPRTKLPGTLNLKIKSSAVNVAGIVYVKEHSLT
jgi:hypothetical protein